MTLRYPLVLGLCIPIHGVATNRLRLRYTLGVEAGDPTPPLFVGYQSNEIPLPGREG